MQSGTCKTAIAIALTCAMVMLTGCGPSLPELDSLASSGRINEKAPVIAHVHAEIAASPAVIWSLLDDAPAWPQWEKNIAKVSIHGPLTRGKRFTWGDGSNTVHSQVQLFEPGQRLSWTGVIYTAKAIHLWRLTPQSKGQTLVSIDESMDGPLMVSFLSSRQLTEAGNAWLADLKKAAESQPFVPQTSTVTEIAPLL